MLSRRKLLRASPAALLALAALAPAPPAQDGIAVRAHYGFGDAVPAGAPCPLTLEIENRGGEAVALAITVQETSLGGLAAPFLGRRVEVSPGTGRLVTLLLPADDDGNMTLGIAAEPRTPISLGLGSGKPRSSEDRRAVRLQLAADPAPRAVRNGVLVLGGKARQLAGALDPGLLAGRREQDGVLLVDGSPDPLGTLDARVAPDTWLAYSGLATILWTAPEPAEMPDPAQLRALREWVQAGGRLVLLAAGNPEVFATGLLAELWPSAPRSATAAYPCPEGVAAADWARTGTAFEVPEERRLSRIPPAADGWLSPLPMVRAERFLGEGTVVLAGFDPMAYDLGRPLLLAAALEAATGLRIRFGERSDSAGEKAALLTDFGGEAFWHLLLNGNVLRPPLGLFLLLGLVFVLVIGPVDYSFLKRLGKLSWSPVTLLVYTALFSGICIGATYFIFAPKREVNRVALLHLTETPEGEEWAHGWIHHGIYTPTGATFRPAPEGFDCYGTASGGGGDSLSMPRRFRPFAADPQLWLGSGRQPLDLDLGFNAFRATSTRIGGKPEGTIGIEVRKGEGPAGLDITVHNQLARPLKNVTVLARDLFVRFADVAPGEESRRSVVRSRGSRPALQAGFLGHQVDGRRFSKDDDVPAPFAEDLLLATAEPRVVQDVWTMPGHLERALAAGRAVLTATMTDTPFADPVAGSARGFTFVHVRKVFDLDP